MVIAPASTGIASNSRNAVTSIAQTNSGILCSVMPGARMLKMVVMKLMAPSSELAPARCSANSVQSMPMPGSKVVFESGGYSVQPVPDSPRNRPVMISMNAGGSSQKLMLFSRGKAMSGAPIMSGMNQLPKPPISAGMTEKKIISSPCAVTMVFHSCPEVTMVLPGKLSCARMISDRMPPTMPPTDREAQIERADVLVVRAAQPAHDEAGLVVVVIVRVVMGGCRHRPCSFMAASSATVLVTCRQPLPIAGAAAALSAGAAHPRTSSSPRRARRRIPSAGTARTTIGMRLWLVPQIWLHSP